MAEFRIDQVGGAGTGVAGESRLDLVPGFAITLVATSPAPGPGVSFVWELLDQVGSPAAVLSGETTDTATIGSGGALSFLSGFSIKLTATDASEVVTTTKRIAAIRSELAEIRPALFGENAPTSQTLASNDPDLSTDNSEYPNLAGRGSPGKNPFGWREWAYEVVKATEQNAADIIGVEEDVTAAIADLEAAIDVDVAAVEAALAVLVADVKAGEGGQWGGYGSSVPFGAKAMWSVSPSPGMVMPLPALPAVFLDVDIRVLIVNASANAFTMGRNTPADEINSVVADLVIPAQTVPTLFSIISNAQGHKVTNLGPVGVVGAIQNAAGTVTASNLEAGAALSNLAAASVADAKLVDIAALSVEGRATNSAGVRAPIVSTTNDTFLQRVGDAITWAGLTLGMIADGLITRAKLSDAAAHTLVGRSANSIGAVGDISISTDEGLWNNAGVLTSQKAQTANIADGALTEAKLSQSIATVSAVGPTTLTAATITEVTYAAALSALVGPASTTTWAIGLTKYVRKSNTSTFGITFKPNTGGTVQGLGTDVTLTLPGSTIPSSTSTSDMYWAITRDALNTWRVASAQLSNATTSVPGLMSGADKQTTDIATLFFGAGTSTSGVTSGSLQAATVKGPAIGGYLKLDAAVSANGAVLLLEDRAGGANTFVFVRSGSPEGVCSASPPALCFDISTPSIWTKATGSGTTTGWERIPFFGALMDKLPVRFATTTNDSLSGLAARDGVTPIAGERSLVKDHATGASKGIYITSAGAWTRSTDCDASSKVKSGMTVYVSEGTTNGGKFFTLSTPDPIVLGSTSLTFSLPPLATATAQGELSAADKTLIDAITSTSVTSPQFKASAAGTGKGFLVEPSGNSEIYWDATKGVEITVDAVERIMARVSGTTEVSSGQAGTVPVFRMSSTSLSIDVYATTQATPEGAITAATGSLCVSVNASVTKLWLKRTGAGNTGWLQLADVTVATTSVDGLMSAADKTALEQMKIGLASGGIRAVSGNITIDADDNMLTLTASADITLPAAAANRGFGIWKTVASAVTLNIVRAASEQIQGASATYLITDASSAARGYWWIWCDGTNWWVIG